MLISGAALGIQTIINYETQKQNERIIEQNNQQIAQQESAKSAYASSKRGLMCEVGDETTPDRILFFQFNPEEINDTKANNYNTKSYTGFTFNDYVWASGGERSISFKLNFEATAAFNTKFFGKDTAYGFDQVSTLDKVFPRGTLDYTETLQRFQYPKREDDGKPRFSYGGNIPTPRFMPPPIVVFSYGNYYLQGIVADVSVRHTLFNAELIPIRSETDITFKVLEETIFKELPYTAVPKFTGSRI